MSDAARRCTMSDSTGLRTRASTYIHGAATDSEALADHLYSFLSSQLR